MSPAHVANATLTAVQARPSTNPNHIDVSSEYFERFWLPVLGPTSFCLARWAQRERIASFPIDDIGPCIGLNATHGKYSPIWRTVNRMMMFGMIEQSATVPTSFFVTSSVRPLNKAMLKRLPDELQQAEEAWWRNLIEMPTGIRNRSPLIG